MDGSSRLKLNPDKTQFMWVGSGYNIEQIDIDSIHVASSAVKVSDTVRGLDTLVDSKLTMTSHVNALSKLALFQLRQIRTIKRCLP